MADQRRQSGWGVLRMRVSRWLARRNRDDASRGAAPAAQPAALGDNEKTIPIVRRRAATAAPLDTITPSIIDHYCPLCGADMAFRVAPGGGGRAHLRCTRHPQCAGTREV